jgi:hypothetical protein
VAALQTLRQQAQADAIVPKNLDQTSPFTAEGKDSAVERVLLKDLLDLHGQASHSTPHIGGATGKIDADARRCGDHDRSSAAKTRRNAAPSTFASTRTDTPRDSVISIRPSG